MYKLTKIETLVAEMFNVALELSLSNPADLDEVDHAMLDLIRLVFDSTLQLRQLTSGGSKTVN